MNKCYIMTRRTHFYMFLSVFIFLAVDVNSEKCVQESPCSCEFEDGRQINLKSLAEKSFLSTTTSNEEHNLIYYFHACTDKKPPFTLNITGPNECQNTSLCLVDQAKNVTTAINLGNAKDVKFTFATTEEKYLVYNNKHNITTIIHLACSDYPENILDFKQKDSNTHNLILISQANCAFYVKTGLSTGSILVILLCTFSAVYLLGGAAVLHLLRGARGKEMIPNIEFWTDLPLLVKDGAVFLQNGCKPIMSNVDSYDRI